MPSTEDSSESSFDDSFGSSKDDPPTLDETMFDANLFLLFLHYMKSHQQAGNLMFLRDARHFHMLNMPRDIIVAQAGKLILTYLNTAAVMPVTVSDEVKKQMLDYAFDPVSELKIDQNIFAVAFGEVYNAVVPHFRNWISTNEWREAIPFRRIPPPNFTVVLGSTALRALFNKYLKNLADRGNDDTATCAFHMWQFALIASDFREGKYTFDSHLDSKKKKKKKDEPESSDDAETPETPEEEDKKMKPEEYAKKVYKKFKHYISLPYDDTLPYAVFIVRALDRTIEEFDKSALFARWNETKPYQGVDYHAKIVHQSVTAQGFTEPPTLAAAATSSILPVFMATVQGSEQGMNLEFLIDIIAFHHKFRKFDDKDNTSSNSSSDTSGGTRADMVEEAKRIFKKFLDKTEMYCDPTLVEEVRVLITKGGGKGIHPAMFRKCGAFIYHRSEHTWCREARATFGWVGVSYDNRSKNARRIEEEFSLSLLPEGFDLQIVPSIDDILENSALCKDYYAYVNEKTGNHCDKFLEVLNKYLKTPVNDRRPLLNKMVGIFNEAGEKDPANAPYAKIFSEEVAHRDRITDSVLYDILVIVMRNSAAKCYRNWLIEHASVWKNEKWSPATAVRCGDLSLLVGLSAVESKIEEEALKGKSGFSRYMAKRQLKKQAMRKGHSTTAADLKTSTSVLSTSTTISRDEDRDSSDVANDSVAMSVPTLKQTLSSEYLRQLFSRLYLDTALGPSETALWEALCQFCKKYEDLENEKLAEAQDDMRKEALDICDNFKVLIPNNAEVKERVKKQKILFPQLFRPLEEELYKKHHAAYEEALRKKGWK